jgi:hypothetical protein
MSLYRNRRLNGTGNRRNLEFLTTSTGLYLVPDQKPEVDVVWILIPAAIPVPKKVKQSSPGWSVIRFTYAEYEPTNTTGLNLGIPHSLRFRFYFFVIFVFSTEVIVSLSSNKFVSYKYSAGISPEKPQSLRFL